MSMTSHAAISVPRLVNQQEHAAAPGRCPFDAALVARRALGSRFCSGALYVDKRSVQYESVRYPPSDVPALRIDDSLTAVTDLA